jgi:2,5-diamino-6-(ribosylamino)-4(3H)-pyrimidinone 5'-phosphate reductase
VVAHVAVGLDGATTGFEPRAGLFYDLASTWSEDVTLVGADTILAQEAALTAALRPGPAPDGPLLAVVDGRSRVREWDALRDVGHWSDVVALRCAATPLTQIERPARQLVRGVDRVDLAAVLDEFGRAGARTVRVDSGGELIGALLAAGLVDEVSLLVHPVLVGSSGTRRWHGRTPLDRTMLELVAADVIDHDLVWLRYLTGGRNA